MSGNQYTNFVLAKRGNQEAGRGEEVKDMYGFGEGCFEIIQAEN